MGPGTGMLMYALLAWISTTGQIDFNMYEVQAGTGEVATISEESLPDIRVVDAMGMAEDVERCNGLSNYTTRTFEEYRMRAATFRAFYCANLITLKGDINTPGELAVLVHELVHWVQDYNGDWDRVPCLQALEWDAYTISHKWQRLHGQPSHPGRFTAWVRSQCA